MPLSAATPVAVFELRADFLQTRSKHSNLFLQLFNGAVFFYKRLVLLEELVE